MKFYEKVYFSSLLIVLFFAGINLIIKNYDIALLYIIPFVLILYNYFRKTIGIFNFGLLILSVLLIIYNSSAHMKYHFMNKLTHDLHIYISYIWLLIFSYKLSFVFNKVILYLSYFFFIAIFGLVVFVTYKNTGIYTIEILLFVLAFLLKDIHSEAIMDIPSKETISQIKSTSIKKYFLSILVAFMLIVFGIILIYDHLLIITLYIGFIYFVFELYKSIKVNEAKV